MTCILIFIEWSLLSSILWFYLRFVFFMIEQQLPVGGDEIKMQWSRIRWNRPAKFGRRRNFCEFQSESIRKGDLRVVVSENFNSSCQMCLQINLCQSTIEKSINQGIFEETPKWLKAWLSGYRENTCSLRLHWHLQKLFLM